VTNQTKFEYISLISEHKLIHRIKPQLDAFKEGFFEVISAAALSIFDDHELELLISGLPDIDLDDWRKNTDYGGGYTSRSKEIKWFWLIIDSFNEEERAKLLQFVTGTTKVPLGGFAYLRSSNDLRKFSIFRETTDQDRRLPTSRTCFNQLYLPVYSSHEVTRLKLLAAITESSTGFGQQ
jgi:hypothetical protein